MNTPVEQNDQILLITKRLLIFVGISFGITCGFLGAFLLIDRLDKFYTSWLVLQCGIIGGFVSIQQRLNKMDAEELSLLSGSWYTVLLIPVYGGIFSLILYILFLSGIITNSLFPEFYYPNFDNPVTPQNILEFLKNCYPSTGPDLAKLIIWSFIAGFSERFVPQILQTVARKPKQDQK
jgi:hypothetical protein